MRAIVLKPVSFSVAHASVGDYRLLASSIRSRAALARCLPERAGNDEVSARYLPVRIQLRGLFIELFIELGTQNSVLRITGFRNTFENWQAPPEGRFRHVRDAVAPPGILRAEALSFEGEVPALEAVAEVGRTGLSLGRRPMMKAVMWLHRNTDPKCTARGMLVLGEMLCEAARSPVVAQEMSRIWMTGGPLPARTEPAVPAVPAVPAKSAA
ncbi:ribosome-inactivating family protein [Streptomyces goshikiensis]|uniref:ribosome-inactivating family protein n=1 Tax=Streptomyces goshikiensis TaxID=1942 RepID=UPI00366A134E